MKPMTSGILLQSMTEIQHSSIDPHMHARTHFWPIAFISQKKIKEREDFWRNAFRHGMSMSTKYFSDRLSSSLVRNDTVIGFIYW